MQPDLVVARPCLRWISCFQLKKMAGSQKLEHKKGIGAKKKRDRGNPEITGADSVLENEAGENLKGSETIVGNIQLPSTKLRKEVWMVTDPLDFPPSRYHKCLFKCNQPFVTLSHNLPSYNKFGGLQMKEEVRDKVVAFLLDPWLDLSWFHESHGELSGCVLHVSLFHRIWHLTKPSKRLMESIDALEEEHEIQFGVRKRPKTEKLPLDDENEDFLLSDGIEAVQNDTEVEWSSSESFVMGDEMMPDDGEEAGKGRTDLRISVFNSSNLKLKKKFGRREEVDPQKTICIVECKWDAEDENAVYQAASYACQEALRNISNLHLDPIYILVLSKSKWKYGILDLRGKINVVAGRIDIISFTEFSEHEGIRFSDNLSPLEELEKQLEESTLYYQRHFSSCPGAVYPTKQFVVGTLFIGEKWYSLPDSSSVNGGMRFGVHLFYEGLLKMIIGEKVTAWEIADFDRAKELKKNIRKEQQELIFAIATL